MNGPRWFLAVGLILGSIIGICSYYLALNQNRISAPPDTKVSIAKTSSGHTIAAVDSNGAMPARQGEGGEETSVYQYDAHGQLQAIIYKDGSTYTYQYNANGDKIREVTRTGRVWSYSYDQNHHPLFVIDPEGRKTTSSASTAAP
jgi:YD repeat-containing protein